MFVILCMVVVYTYQAEGSGNTSVSLVEVLATPYARVKLLAKPM